MRPNGNTPALPSAHVLNGIWKIIASGVLQIFLASPTKYPGTVLFQPLICISLISLNTPWALRYQLFTDNIFVISQLSLTLICIFRVEDSFEKAV